MHHDTNQQHSVLWYQRSLRDFSNISSCNPHAPHIALRRCTICVKLTKASSATAAIKARWACLCSTPPTNPLVAFLWISTKTSQSKDHLPTHKHPPLTQHPQPQALKDAAKSIKTTKTCPTAVVPVYPLAISKIPPTSEAVPLAPHLNLLSIAVKARDSTVAIIA